MVGVRSSGAGCVNESPHKDSSTHKWKCVCVGLCCCRFCASVAFDTAAVCSCFAHPPPTHTHANRILGATPRFEMHSISVAFNGIPVYLPPGKHKATIPTQLSKLIHSLTAHTSLFSAAVPSDRMFSASILDCTD